jgi:hypothetical protein
MPSPTTAKPASSPGLFVLHWPQWEKPQRHQDTKKVLALKIRFIVSVFLTDNAHCWGCVNTLLRSGGLEFCARIFGWQLAGRCYGRQAALL